MQKVRVIFISSVKPEPTNAGQIILYRHFCNRPEFDLEVYGYEPTKFSFRMVLRRILGRLARLGGVFETLVNCAWVLWAGRWIDADLPTKVDRSKKTIVGTVAHGDGFYAAQRFAKKKELPLVVFFQDWWPDMAGVPKSLIKLLDMRFLELAKSCSIGICVCEEMKKALGGGDNLHVLPPIPAESRVVPIRSNATPSETKVFRVLYFGNLDFYGEMLLGALQVFKDHPTIQLQVRGANPCWSEEVKNEMREAGLWLDFAPRAELDSWLESADAFLVPMVFDQKYRRRMETSFPSKLIEFAQFGNPLIVWGPEYCSAVQWAQKDNRALCITKPEANCLRERLERLITSPSCMEALAQKIMKTSLEELNPLPIQRKFKTITNTQC